MRKAIISSRFLQEKKINFPFLILVVFLAVLIRYYLMDFESGDYQIFLSPWMDFIKAHGGFPALRYGFANQSPLYVSCLTLVSYLAVSPLYAIKFFSILFDFVAASLVYLIVWHKCHKAAVSLLAFSAVLFAPTVIVNGSMWGQCDIVYTSFLLAAVYFLLKQKNNWAMVSYAVAFSFKLQAIFLAPLFVILLLRRKTFFKHLLIFPLVYIVSLLPSALAGRPWKELLSVYWEQTSIYTKLTLSAPNLYQWLPEAARTEAVGRAGLVFSAAVAITFIFFMLFEKERIDSNRIIEITLAFALLLPFTLPRMHERYFFPADVFSIVFAFYFPRYFYLPIIMQIVSFLSYGPFLFGKDIDFFFPTLGVLLVIIIVLSELIKLKEDVLAQKYSDT